MKNRCVELKRQKRPMTDEQFANIELKLRSLRTEEIANEDEFIVVDFATIYEDLLFIQAISVKSFKLCRVEVAFKRKGKKFPAIYAKDNVPIDESVKIFRDICCSVSKPDLKTWQYITEEILLIKNMEDK